MKTKSKKIVVAGIICLDITPIIKNISVKKVDDIFQPGQIIKADGITVHTGGVVANTGLGLKKLGADVLLMAKVGNDMFGRVIIDTLKEYDAADYVKVSDDVSTAYSVVIAVPGIDRIFIHDAGASDTFGIDDLNLDIIKDASIFHFGYPPSMRNMYINRAAECIKIFKTIKEMGVSTSLDMAIVDQKSESAMADWNSIIKNLIPYVDLFTPSVEELSFMIDREGYNKLREKAGNGDIMQVITKEYIKGLADTLIGWGAKVVMIKCGVHGIYLRTGSREQLGKVGHSLRDTLEKLDNIEYFQPSFDPGKVVSGTGAGDASIAAFLYAVQCGFHWKRCVELAAASGASCVTAYDSLSGLKTLSELNEKIEAGWPTLNTIAVNQ